MFSHCAKHVREPHRIPGQKIGPAPSVSLLAQSGRHHEPPEGT